MSITESLKQRRTYYNINQTLPVEESRVTGLVQELTELVPDAFNMKSSFVAVAFGAKHELLWDTIYDTFGGKVSREKIDSFKNGAGTILYFYDSEIVKSMQGTFPLYAANFPNWAQQASAMLQISVWSGLRELGIGASLQHYNPVIDEKIRQLFKVPDRYQLVAQMPFGGIGQEPGAKEKEEIDKRVQIFS